MSLERGSFVDIPLACHIFLLIPFRSDCMVSQMNQCVHRRILVGHTIHSKPILTLLADLAIVHSLGNLRSNSGICLSLFKKDLS